MSDTIYFIGCEMGDFLWSGPLGTFNSNADQSLSPNTYTPWVTPSGQGARYALEVRASTAPIFYICPFSQPAAGEFWTGGYANPQSSGFGNVCYTMLWLDPSGLPRIGLRNAQGLSYSGALFPTDAQALVKINSTGAETVLCTLPANSFAIGGPSQRFDVKIDYSTSGEVEFYVNKVLRASFSGDVTTDGNTEIGEAYLGPFGYFGGEQSAWSAVCISSFDTREVNLLARNYSGAGDDAGWTGGGYQYMSLPLPNFLSVPGGAGQVDTAAAAGLSQLYTVGINGPYSAGQQVALGSGAFVFAVVDILSAVAGSSPGDPTRISAMKKVSGSYYTSAPQAAPATIGPMQFCWTASPATGGAWSPSELNDAGYQTGYQSVA